MKHVIALSLLSASLLASNAMAHGDEDHHGKSSGHDAALGEAGIASEVTRTIKVEMSDAMRFNPSKISAKQGETIRFVVKNSGTVRHEMVLGSVKELKEHAELMRKFPEMEHSDPNQVQVQPGKSGELIWKFSKAGTFDFACLQPGHYEAGMAGKVSVK